jgi:hypothetical protein
MLRSLMACCACVAFLACGDDPASPAAGFDGAWYLYKSTNPYYGVYSPSTAEEIIVIGDGVGTYYFLLSADTSCHEGEAFDGSKEGASIVNGQLRFVSPTDTTWYKPWTGPVPPWPETVLTNDC